MQDDDNGDGFWIGASIQNPLSQKTYDIDNNGPYNLSIEIKSYKGNRYYLYLHLKDKSNEFTIQGKEWIYDIDVFRKNNPAIRRFQIEQKSVPPRQNPATVKIEAWFCRNKISKKNKTGIRKMGTKWGGDIELKIDLKK